MIILKDINKMASFAQTAKRKAKRIGFVPTMGALHEGHLSLIRKARKENDLAVVSIFINPIQFGPKEDLKKYPRNLKQDTRLCKAAGVDVIFYPAAKEMYSKDHKTYVQVDCLSDVLCGKFRPGHFKGVATVVAKLFNIVQPDAAYFGAKDAQQAIIIKKMAQDLNMPVKIKVLPTLRHSDGLAMSSRNVYLNREERKEALVLSQALRLGKALLEKGIRNSRSIIRQMRQLIGKKKSANVDYIAIVDTQNLMPLERVRGNCMIALAVEVGKIRLIDNIQVER